MKKLTVLLFSIFFSALSSFCSAQYTDLLNFNYTNGADPYGSLILVGNVLYGMTGQGGVPNYAGNIFRIDTDGSNYKDLLDFNGTTGYRPWGNLTFSEGKLYGMTLLGGTGAGNIFSIDTDGSKFKNLYSFYGSEGVPYGSLIISGSTLYGMAGGGLNGDGFIFSIDTDGTNYKVIFNFNGTTGREPEGTLTILRNKLYGATPNGGVYDSGCIFSIDTNGGGYKKLFDFNGANGMSPTHLALVFSEGNLYGTTTNGGAHGIGCLFSIDTSGNKYKDMFDFDGLHGREPDCSLTLVGNILCGTTIAGGTNDAGCIFSIDTNGSNYMVLLNFNDTNGEYPSSLIYYDHILYGMTQLGGSSIQQQGVVYSLKAVNLGIDKLTAKNDLVKVYPNPSSGLFTLVIASEARQSLSTIEIYNVLGEKVYTLTQPSGASATFQLNLSAQPNGIYLYRVSDENGSLVGEGKLVIAR